MLKRFFAWIGSLMRRRHFVAGFGLTVSPPPPPPPPGGLTIPQVLLALLEL